MIYHEGIKKIVLAYSGGLDTSIIIPWLKENYNNPEIIAVAGNVGQADELEGLEAKAIATGASKLIVADLVDEMVDEVIIPAGTTSPYSLYSENLVTFGESDYDQNQAAGFINLWGLPTKVQALREQGKL